MSVRVGIIGAGLAGTLLAWRVKLAHPSSEVELLTGSPAVADATSVSGGLVRCFETDPVNRELATDSLVELRGSDLLSAWAGYQEIGSVYVCAAGATTGLDEALRRIERRLPGSARLADAAELTAAHAWAALPATSVAVVERRAGYVSPGRLRRNVLGQLGRLGVRALPGAVAGVGFGPDGGVRCHVAGDGRSYDAAVVAAGRWTAGLLTRNDLPAAGYRTKAIQYGLYRGTNLPAWAFIDDTTGLYGRPSGRGRVLLGMPSDRWDVDADQPPSDRELERRAAKLTTVRFPRLRLAALLETVAAADCYTDPPRLELRAVPAGSGRLHTFTGGSGGAAKTALAASRIAAEQLIDVLAGAARSPSSSSGSSPR